VDTAYYATRFGYPKGNDTNVTALLEQMQGIANRRAAMVSTLVAVRSAGDPEPLIAVGRVVVEITTEHVTKQKNDDGSVTETKRISNALTDLVEEHLNDIAEDASEAYLSKGNTPDYFAAFIYGVSADRETEKSVLKKIDSIRSEIGSIVFSMAGEWSDDVARSLGVSDKEAAIAKQSNLIGSLAQLLAKANELNAAKAKRESKKAKV
jgi:hypothetical protein